MRLHHASHHADPHYAAGQFPLGRTGGPKPRAATASFHHDLQLEEHTGHLRITAPPQVLRVPVIVVRHGQTTGNITGQFQGQIDEADHALNATGREQVRQGAQRIYAMLSDLFGDHVNARLASGAVVVRHSPLSRARDTADAFLDYVAEHAGARLAAGVEKRLSEKGFGVAEGCTLDEVRHDPELYAQACRYRAEDASVDWLGTGESYVDVVVRARAWLEAIDAEYAGCRRLVIAFSHGVTINALRTLFHDPALVDERGVVGFRRHFLDNAEACWLGNSQQLARQIMRAGF